MAYRNREARQAGKWAVWVIGLLMGAVFLTSLSLLGAPAAQATKGAMAQANGCTPGERLQDGGFEAGLPNPVWQTSSNVQSDILDDSPLPAPHSGTWKAWMGGDNLIQESLWQLAEIASDAATVELSFWWRVDSFETTHPFDTLEVQVRDAAGSPLETLETLTDGDESSTWEQSTFDVSAYAGRAIQIAFVDETDDTNPTSFFLDDVSLTQTCATTPTPTTAVEPTASVEPTSTVTPTATVPAGAPRLYLPLILRSNNRVP